MQAMWEKRPSYSVEVDRKSSNQRMPSGNLIPVISRPLPNMWTVKACRYLPEEQNSSTLSFILFF